MKVLSKIGISLLFAVLILSFICLGYVLVDTWTPHAKNYHAPEPSAVKEV